MTAKGPGQFPSPPRSRPGRISPLLHVSAAAAAAAGVGFAAYVYFVPYQHQLAELKRRTGELRTIATEHEARRKEVGRLKQDLVELQGARNARLGAEGRIRSNLKALKVLIADRLSSLGGDVRLGPRHLLVRFPEDALFEAHGPTLHKTGQEAMRMLAEILGDRARRLLVAAPMGRTQVPRSLRAQFPAPADLSAARSANALRALAKAGVQSESAVAVIGTLVAPDDAAAPATLDIEVDPKE